ncbi:putative metal-binding motif-containing protein [Candidatus Uhrbacteria bacterium]|nr:putative metal-binding motif-containing protein [Candidatus Uhrbacteria bacterium]
MLLALFVPGCLFIDKDQIDLLLDDETTTTIHTDTDDTVDTSIITDTACVETVEYFYCSDDDGDGWGSYDPADCVYADPCDVPNGYVQDNSDCNDTSATVNPDAEEVCDEVDNDCDGDTDEDVQNAFYEDVDGDGYGDVSSTTDACSAPSGYVEDQNDCDDADGTVYPDSLELCDGLDNDCTGAADDGGACTDGDGDGYYDSQDCDDADASVSPAATEACDGIDNDCDGDTDEELDFITSYADLDGDGYGDDATAVEDCDIPAGYIELGGDCDDTDTAYNPSAIEDDCTDPNDYNCDGSGGATDADGDGYAACEDCDDGDASVSPVATETCDEIDNDCDGDTDEDDAIDASIWYADADVDGYGDVATTTVSCEAPENYVADATDCDDSQKDVNPGQTEVCDGIDNDCDGSTDEDDAADATTWYLDQDGDGWGDSSMTTVSCEQPSDGAAVDGDCDDGDTSVSPGEVEVCDGIDNDCDGTTDIGAADAQNYHSDSDGDGYGDSPTSWTGCEGDEPAGAVLDSSDCDDTDASVNPAAEEICQDGVDQNCTGGTDEGYDFDGDGYDFYDATSCPTGDDCEDDEGEVHPGAIEVCDSRDNDCDGDIDSTATDITTWYLDADEDGYGDVSVSQTDCDEPSGYVEDGTDCDDTDEDVNPGGYEVYYDVSMAGSGIINCGDGADNDCDGDTDEDDSQCGDEDNDTIPDGVDYLFVCDLDLDGSNEAVCLWALQFWDSPWSASDCLTQERPYTSLSASSSASLETMDWGGETIQVCPVYPTVTGNWDYRAVSSLGADGTSAVDTSDCSDWIPADLANYCSDWGDTLCTTSSLSDGCDTVGRALAFSWDGTSVTP